jgi:hypothetical protein
MARVSTCAILESAICKRHDSYVRDMTHIVYLMYIVYLDIVCKRHDSYVRDMTHRVYLMYIVYLDKVIYVCTCLKMSM